MVYRFERVGACLQMCRAPLWHRIDPVWPCCSNLRTQSGFSSGLSFCISAAAGLLPGRLLRNVCQHLFLCRLQQHCMAG